MAFADRISPQHKRYIADTWLARSRDSPLSTSIYYCVYTPDILPVLLPHSGRWEYLQLRISSLPAINRPMPLLREINITLEIRPPVLVLREAPLLRTVTLASSDGFVSSVNVNLPWEQLTSLTLRSPSTAECMLVLEKTPLLRHCELVLYAQNDSEFEFPGDMGLLHLESLTLDSPGGAAPGILAALVVPTLRRLHIQERSLESFWSVPALAALQAKCRCTLQQGWFMGARIGDVDGYRAAFPSSVDLDLNSKNPQDTGGGHDPNTSLEQT
ncbi:hypothetical protein B0H14DRAFT_3154120 [Mycena olivaceomarginata]|nr:hypothetical protein B0H14DRAFT_3154120 [Mycena olivaceomarginata]